LVEVSIWRRKWRGSSQDYLAIYLVLDIIFSMSTSCTGN
jgi:hypothetical protein